MELKYTVHEGVYYNTIRQVLIKEFSFSHRFLSKMKLNNRILLNGSPMYVDKEIVKGDIISVDIDLDENLDNVVPTEMDIDILYEDDCLLIVNKPAGIAIHPSSNHYSTSLSNGVAYYYKQNNIKKKIHLVNRLDKDTSGIVVIAKNEYIQECLIKQMKDNVFSKEYVSILEGKVENKNGKIDLPIKRKENSIIERCVAPDGDRAVTYYSVIKYIGNNTLVSFKLETGRTHQLRVHSKYIGHPILGDTLYGTPSPLIPRQALHANKTSFIHPIAKKRILIEADLPEDMKKIV